VLKIFVARDKDGSLALFSEKPDRENSLGIWGVEVQDEQTIAALPKDLFSNLKWDSEPIEVELKAVEPKLYCHSCGAELTEQDLEGPEHDEDGNIICDDCYHEEYCFECCLCGEYGDVKDQHNMVVVFEESMVEPGLYRVLNESYWAAPLLGKAIIFPHAVERIGDIPEGANDRGYQLGHLCADCQEKVMK
jgi:hypothetical protein